MSLRTKSFTKLQQKRGHSNVLTPSQPSLIIVHGTRFRTPRSKPRVSRRLRSCRFGTSILLILEEKQRRRECTTEFLLYTNGAQHCVNFAFHFTVARTFDSQSSFLALVAKVVSFGLGCHYISKLQKVVENEKSLVSD